MKKKVAKGFITWIDEECVGFKCECGEIESVIVGIYKDIDYSCLGCGRKYILKQSNIVFQITE